MRTGGERLGDVAGKANAAIGDQWYVRFLIDAWQNMSHCLDLLPHSKLLQTNNHALFRPNPDS